MKSFFKKFLFVKVLFFLNLNLFAPVQNSIPVPDQEPVDPFRQLIYAVGKVETNLDTVAYNPLEEATGYFQIRPIRVEDYNRRTGSNHTLEEMYNYEVAEKIFRYYASKIGPYDYEKIAKDWNGSGSMTIDYWKKVRVYL